MTATLWIKQWPKLFCVCSFKESNYTCLYFNNGCTKQTRNCPRCISIKGTVYRSVRWWTCVLQVLNEALLDPGFLKQKVKRQTLDWLDSGIFTQKSELASNSILHGIKMQEVQENDWYPKNSPLIALCTVFTENISTHMRDLFILFSVLVSFLPNSTHSYRYISLGKCFVGAQNCRGINYENTKKCLTGSKVAHVRLTHLMHTQHKSKTGHTQLNPQCILHTSQQSLCIVVIFFFWHMSQQVCARREQGKNTLYHTEMFHNWRWPTRTESTLTELKTNNVRSVWVNTAKTNNEK